MLTKLKDKFSALSLPESRLKPQWLMAAGAVLLTGAIVFSLWRSNQGYVALYGSQEKLPVAQVVEVLGAESIAYRINPDNGQILIPEDKLPRARMALAAKGITAVMPDGYELMDKEEMLGSSQFVQNVRYKRSLEGELARSIMALDPVENARVHLGLSESSSFVMTNKPQSSASVMLQLHYGKHLDEQQVAAIVQLVAGSVPGMQAASVRVVDQSGNLLSENGQQNGSNMANIRQGRDVVERIKNETINNISGLLTPLFGSDNFRISVTPSVDMSSVEETQERLGKEPQISDENISRENTTNELAIGIPGSLSNRPVNQPAQPVAPQAAANPQAAQTQAQTSNPSSLSSRSQEQRKYAFDRDIRHIRHPGYKLEKLRVAVALNQAAPSLASMTPEQLTALTRLVEDAAGIEKARGDSLTLDRLAFVERTVDGLPVLKWWQDPNIQYWGQNGGIGMLILLTLLFGLRPLAQRYGRREPSERVAIEGSAQKDAVENELVTTEAGLAGLPGPAFNQDTELPPQSSGLETKVEYLQMLAENETERMAEVLKQWINSNERTDSKS
ncbi:flagellar basal-body MS-ring/collar protein FliF [Enterobacter huaxiensis]|uniref:Flagellar M-ring protein n=1 Tax=Enterobacter huaxiensis TaxID=2494702 RepID=A0A428LHK6_9ENTR|nr:flagellar basal-body MS-ring/collar protein FliF [Enterobacter huaxiensis]MCS5451946.1 flagellar basal-body MS-ring/collar protein FliF [Enterobacter huaxiensis]MEB7544936.1 flagellar M-ring protein FliF [Enterobacter huaxiensis]MEB7583187.1 flagellar M-ring protein FliF [Enterobacter huaxiensis]MEB7665414.1 flagellar M-ring protein FliF [Enterobacter huaxiensis]RSK63487.1 flagellar M-ring protein FliF [Enterobacter huaxiensis]